MKNLLLCMPLAMLFSVTVNGNSCQNGIRPSNNNITKEVAGASEFRAIEVSGSPTVEYTQSRDGSTSVYIYGPDNLVELLEVGFSGGTMRVSFKPGTSITGSHKLKVVASSPALEKAYVKGSGDVIIKNRLDATSVTLQVDGSGDVVADNIHAKEIRTIVNGSGDVNLKDCDCETFYAEVKGSGDVAAKGKAESAELKISGSGDITARNLTAKRTSASVAGSGDIECHASESIYSKTSGSGTVTCYGNPANIETSGQGSNFRRR